MQPDLPDLWHHGEAGSCTGECKATPLTAADFIHFSDPPRNVMIGFRNLKGQFEFRRGPPEPGTYIPLAAFKQPESGEPPYTPMPEPSPPCPLCPGCFWALTQSPDWCAHCGWGCETIADDEPDTKGPDHARPL